MKLCFFLLFREALNQSNEELRCVAQFGSSPKLNPINCQLTMWNDWWSFPLESLRNWWYFGRIPYHESWGAGSGSLGLEEVHTVEMVVPKRNKVSTKVPSSWALSEHSIVDVIAYKVGSPYKKLVYSTKTKQYIDAVHTGDVYWSFLKYNKNQWLYFKLPPTFVKGEAIVVVIRLIPSGANLDKRLFPKITSSFSNRENV